MTVTPQVPDHYLDHLESQGLDPGEREQFVAHCQTPLRPGIRFNSLKTTREAFLALAAEARWQLTPIPWCEEGFWIEPQGDESLALGNHIAHLMGKFYLQEASSMLPVRALASALEDSSLVLDMAAAPGSKTTQIAAMMDNGGCLLANELSASRLKSLHANLVRSGVSNSCLSHWDGRKLGSYCENIFDAVLLDAPCGGEGTVRKDPSALKNWEASQLTAMAAIQEQLILSAFTAVKPGGTLVYSTCTLSREENQEICEHLGRIAGDALEIIPLDDLFEGAQPALTPEGYLHVMPHYFDSEGFFVARFRKLRPFAFSETKRSVKPTPAPALDSKISGRLERYLAEQFGCIMNQLPGRWLTRNDEVWLEPLASETLRQSMRLNRSGLKVARIYRREIRLEHEFVMAFGTQLSRNRLTLSAEQAREFISGKDLHGQFPELDSGECLLCYDSSILGLGKHLPGKIKNALPRELTNLNPNFS